LLLVFVAADRGDVATSMNRKHAIHRAFDELRFGTHRTLNLRAQQPTALQATRQVEQWLRQLQVEGADEALVITGRGNQSLDGFSPVREAIIRLLPSLRRRNVISGYEEHTAGSFVVTFAPVGALFEAPKRRRERRTPPSPTDPRDLVLLDGETRRLLRDLANATLAALGVHSPTSALVENEMTRQFSRLAAALPESGDKEALLQQAVQLALEEIENQQ
jgi:hypothetical protein